MNSIKKELSPEEIDELIKVLKSRFDKNLNRHNGFEWAKVQAKLEAKPEKLWSLNEMEETGGEPDVEGYDKKTDEYIFTIVRQKARKDAEAFVMIGKHLNLEENKKQRLQCGSRNERPTFNERTISGAAKTWKL